jgi:hypothetical protein
VGRDDVRGARCNRAALISDLSRRLARAEEITCDAREAASLRLRHILSSWRNGVRRLAGARTLAPRTGTHRHVVRSRLREF